MLGKDFDRIADPWVLARLEPLGWTQAARGAFVLPHADGVDRLALDPGAGFASFAVLLSPLPTDMADFAQALMPDVPNDGTTNGFLCGPYLSLGKVGRRKHTWPSRTTEQLLASLEKVMAALLQTGLPWLATLRDPSALAEHADPIAAALCGYAWERAGQHEKAHERYRAYLRPLEEIDGMRPGHNPAPRNMKQYLLLAARMGLENGFTARYRAIQGAAGL